MSEWIKCSDRLPEANKAVLAFRLGAIVGFYMKPDGLWYQDGFCIKQHNGFDDVTHWMPLPAPPEDV